MQETWFNPWIRKSPLEKEIATSSNILAWRTLDRGVWWATVHGVTKRLDVTSVQFSLVAYSCLTICDPMNYSTPGLTVHHHLSEVAQIHVHRVGDAIQPAYPLSSPSALHPSQHTRSFPVSWLFASAARVLETFSIGLFATLTTYQNPICIIDINVYLIINVIDIS